MFDFTENFFDNVILKPNFYKPENYELEIITHNSIRNSLFSQTIEKVNNPLFSRFKKLNFFI